MARTYHQTHTKDKMSESILRIGKHRYKFLQGHTVHRWLLQGIIVLVTPVSGKKDHLFVRDNSINVNIPRGIVKIYGYECRGSWAR